MNRRTISFKSAEPFRSKEMLGYKCNTVRKVDPSDYRYVVLMEIIQGITREEVEDWIIITPTGMDSGFSRKITDVSYFDERFIISWEHKNE